MAEMTVEEVNARFEELSLLEEDFEETENEIIRKQNELNGPLYKKRAEVVAKIPHFWALVLESAPPDIDNYIQPSDSKIFADCLETLEVTRFEIDEPNGSPRSFAIKFGFSENEYFEDKVLEKKFWYRVSSEGWEGLVSEPVKINWKKGKDVTEGLTDAAVALFKAKAANAGKKKADKDLPEYEALVKLIEQSDEASNSFFAWFAFVSSYQWVSAEENLAESKKKAERIEKQRRGEKVELPEPDNDQTLDFQETEVFLQGDELATLIADDMWPSAIKYFKHAHEAEDDDEDLSDLSVDYGDDDGDDDSDDDIDIRALVGKGRPGSSGSPPPNPKKARKA